MCNQMVLRGGGCISESSHLRASYRNFFYPWDRWPVSGIRLARNEAPSTSSKQTNVAAPSKALLYKAPSLYKVAARPSKNLKDPKLKTSDFHDLRGPVTEDVVAEILAGLRAESKSIDPKFLYDEQGSALFEMITVTDEYYLTRAENTLLQLHANDIATAVGKGEVLIEPGCGVADKVEILLPALQPALYLGSDIAESTLRRAQQRLAQKFTATRCVAAHAGFDQLSALANLLPPLRRTLFFPGSTIGNFTPHRAAAFLHTVRELVGVGGGLLIGVDLHKDKEVLDAAYNDGGGITAAFNLNILRHVGRLLQTEIRLSQFEHVAFYNEQEHRMELYVRSRSRHHWHLPDGSDIRVEEGELIHTEYSYKYSVESFTALAGSAGFERIETWTDPQGQVALHYLIAMTD